MGEADRYIDYRDKNNGAKFLLGQPGNPLMILLTINIVVFLLLFITRLFYLMTNQTGQQEILQYDFTQWVSLHGNLNSFFHKPWTLLTFMFSHSSIGDSFPLILSTAGNLLWLSFFGRMLMNITNEKHLIPVYLYGGFAGAIVFITGVNLIPFFANSSHSLFLLGANCSIIAIATTVTLLYPQYKIFQNIGTGIPLWPLTLIYVVLNLAFSFSASNATGLGIVGASLMGFVYVYFLKRNIDLGKWMHHLFQWFKNIFNPPLPAKPTIFYNTGKRKPYTKSPNITPQRVDEILDKINSKGYQALSEDEKKILKKASEE